MFYKKRDELLSLFAEDRFIEAFHAINKLFQNTLSRFLLPSSRLISAEKLDRNVA
jgi:hypothetical protein